MARSSVFRKPEFPARRRKLRSLRLSSAGAWYLALTIIMGVVALMSGNNILYLIESLLLSGLIFSGVLSERTIAALWVEIQRRPAQARSPVRDQVILRNTRSFPLFCIEISEWVGERQLPIAFVPRIGPKETVILPSSQIIESRGRHAWRGFTISTRYPFGFARKSKLVWQPGDRIVWPEAAESSRGKVAQEANERRNFGAAEILEGEIRPYQVDDDLRLVVWTLSGRGTPMVRVRRAPERRSEVFVDLRSEPGPAFESSVSQAAKELMPAQADAEVSLTLVHWEGKRRVRGRVRALNTLALIEPLGASPIRARKPRSAA